jgi:decaprenyl-phosphate phosphoribosyltransferase
VLEAGAAGYPVVQESLAAGLVRAARPKQWIKNLLLLAAPAAAGVLDDGDVLGRLGVAVGVFCLVASGTYLLNDALDVDHDRAHPQKRLRPIAAGSVPAGAAVAVGILLIALGLAISAVVGLDFAAVVAGYVAVTASYTFLLRTVLVLDLVAVASGYVIRLLAGGVAAGVPISRWFFIVAAFGSLFAVTGKRHGEHLDLGPERAAARPTLGEYPREFLRSVWTLTAGVTLTAYCLWAFEQGDATDATPWFELSIVPVVVFVLRYALLVEIGKGSAPEDLVLGDRTLLAVGAIWVLIFLCGVYVGG